MTHYCPFQYEYDEHVGEVNPLTKLNKNIIIYIIIYFFKQIIRWTIIKHWVLTKIHKRNHLFHKQTLIIRNKYSSIEIDTWFTNILHNSISIHTFRTSSINILDWTILYSIITCTILYNIKKLKILLNKIL